MAFLAKALNNFLQQATANNSSKDPQEPKTLTEELANKAPKGPLSSALTAMKRSPSTIPLASEIAQQGPIKTKTLQNTRDFQPAVALSSIANVAIDDQNFAFFGDLETTPITAPKTYAKTEDKETTSVMTREHLSSSPVFKKYFGMPANKQLSFGIFGSMPPLEFSCKKFTLQHPTQPLLIYRQPALMIQIPFKIETKEQDNTKTPRICFTSEPKSLEQTSNIFGVSPFVSQDMIKNARAMYQLPVSISQAADVKVDAKESSWSISHLRSWIKEIMSIARTNNTHPLLSLTGNYPLEGKTLANQSMPMIFKASLQNASISFTIEDDASEGEKASEEDFAKALEEMLSQYFTEGKTRSYEPLTTTLFANLTGGKRVSISIVSGHLDRQTPSANTQLMPQDRKTLQAIMAAPEDKPSLIGKNVNVEYTGRDTQRRESAQTGEVVHESRYFTERLYNTVKAAPAAIYNGSANLVAGAFGYASSRTNKALDAALHRGGAWLGAKANVFIDGFKEGLGPPPSPHLLEKLRKILHQL